MRRNTQKMIFIITLQRAIMINNQIHLHRKLLFNNNLHHHHHLLPLGSFHQLLENMIHKSNNNVNNLRRVQRAHLQRSIMAQDLDRIWEMYLQLLSSIASILVRLIFQIFRTSSMYRIIISQASITIRISRWVTIHFSNSRTYPCPSMNICKINHHVS